MADFAAVLRKTIEGLGENTPETRAKVYGKARATIEAKLAAVSPPPPPQLADRQRALLEDAIAKVEAEYAPPPAPAPEDDLESIFAELDAAAREPAPAAETERTEEGVPEQGEAEEPVSGVSSPDRGMMPPEEGSAIPADENVSAAEVDAGQNVRPDMPVLVGDAEAPHTPEWLAPGTTFKVVDGPGDVSLSRPPEDALDTDEVPHEAPRGSRRGVGRLVLALLLLVALGAAGYAGWNYRDDLSVLAGFQSFDQMIGQADEAAPQPATEEPRAADAGQGAEEGESDAAGAPRKFTQRLLPDGGEVDEGPAAGAPMLGEGTSVAEATTPPDAGQTDGATTNADSALPVGQRAIFYEERTNVSQGSADSGTVVWSLVEESPGDGLPAEPAVRGEVTIPAKGLQLKMTIRRNVDQSLPASHIVELIFLASDNFEGGGIESVRRLAMKRSEQDTGSPLLGIPVKIADGFFLVALSDSRADVETNRLLLRRQSWIDIPMVYASGRRALITMEKGAPGEQIFNEALAAWERASSG